MKNLKQFIGIYPVSKTLRFELKPVGKTAEWIEKAQIIDSDRQKSEDYPKVKKLIDEYHKYCISASLKNVQLDWNPLKEALERNYKEKSDDTQKTLDKEQANMRKHIVKALSAFEHYTELTAATPKDLIKTILPEYIDDPSLDSFDGFATYFKGFQENRKNIYSAEAISTGVAYRLVHDNFPKFIANIDVYNNIKENCPDVIIEAEKEMAPFLEGVQIKDIFSVDFYNSVLTQDGIDFFNRVIGGVSEEGKQKYRGINEFSNLYRQQHPELSAKKKSLTMIPLFKQILSDRETLSYIPAQIENEQQLTESIDKFYLHITQFEKNGKTINILEELAKLTSHIDSYDENGIFLTANKVTEVSQKLFGSWSVLNETLQEQAIQKFGNIEKAANKKKIDSYLKKDAFSVSELNLHGDKNLSMYFSEINHDKDIIDSYWFAYKEWSKGKGSQFLNNTEGIEIVKNLLDALMNFMHKCAVLNVSSDYDVDRSFYNEFLPLYGEIEGIIFLYNRVRNYLTKKPSDIIKFKLNFDAPTLANGWDQNKERDNKTILLFKDGKSFIGVLNPKDVPPLNSKYEDSGESYSKMIYKLLPDPAKDLPHTFFSKKGIDIYHPSEYILKGRELGKYKKGATFDLQFLHDFINFYKDGISKHPDWSKFGFVFSPTESYEDIGGFFSEIAKQAYKIRFTDIPVRTVDEWIEKGQLYLFQLYNKDYAEGAHGRKNLHTLYWENLFTADNLTNLVMKLNGQAELFYRPQSIKKPIVHRQGSKMLNRRDNSGMPIPDVIYQHLYQFYNGKLSEKELSDVEKQYLNKVIVKEVNHEIVKDRRYTKPEFFFHVPITFNVNADGNDYINEDVWNYLKDNPDVNIIGIDRGERHLIYLTLINQKGEILKQKTFNMVGNYNYHAKLEQREKEREEARKSWSSIGKIKDLKEGFLSAVIHEIAVMMVENNAIVVLEDLNLGFKRGRFKVERQVYQKFEKMLIDKLNYLSFKDRKADEEGGILRGYQLAQNFVSFQRLGKQSGFLFYIPAAYTSKIDPVSGFVNHFNFNDITNAEKRKDFFMKMERIEMKNEDIEFEFDYRKFKTYQTDFKNVWTVSTFGKRIVMQPDEKGHKIMKDFYPTQQIIQAFESKGLSIKDGTNIKALLSTIEANAANASFYSTLFYVFQKTLQMRNSNAVTEEDYILSPVAVDGKYFSSTDEANKGRDANGNWISKLPVDADANGAYHIALKGLYLLNHPDTKKVEHPEWLKYMVEKPFLND